MKKLMSIKNFINDLLGTTYQEGSVFSTQHFILLPGKNYFGSRSFERIVCTAPNVKK
ncbi:MAG: hypothetical protein ACXWWD_04430 [Chitinophagaceae bacterium]